MSTSSGKDSTEPNLLHATAYFWRRQAYCRQGIYPRSYHCLLFALKNSLSCREYFLRCTTNSRPGIGIYLHIHHCLPFASNSGAEENLLNPTTLTSLFTFCVEQLTPGKEYSESSHAFANATVFESNNSLLTRNLVNLALLTPLFTFCVEQLKEMARNLLNPAAFMPTFTFRVKTCATNWTGSTVDLRRLGGNNLEQIRNSTRK